MGVNFGGSLPSYSGGYPNKTGMAAIWVPTVDGWWTWRLANFCLWGIPGNYDQLTVGSSGNWQCVVNPNGIGTNAYSTYGNIITKQYGQYSGAGPYNLGDAPDGSNDLGAGGRASGFRWYIYPPRTIDGYTIDPGNRWAFNKNYNCWFEVDKSAFAVIYNNSIGANVIVSFNPILTPSGQNNNALLWCLTQTALTASFTNGTPGCLPVDGWYVTQGGNYTAPDGVSFGISGTDASIIVNPFMYWRDNWAGWPGGRPIGQDGVGNVVQDTTYMYGRIPQVTAGVTSNMNLSTPYGNSGLSSPSPWGYVSGVPYGTQNINQSKVFPGSNNLPAFQKQRDQTSGWPVFFRDSGWKSQSNGVGLWLALDLTQLVLEPYVYEPNRAILFRPTTIGHWIALNGIYYDPANFGNNKYGCWQWQDQSGNWYWDKGCINNLWNPSYTNGQYLALSASLNQSSLMSVPAISATGQSSAKFYNSNQTRWYFNFYRGVWVEGLFTVSPTPISTVSNTQSGKGWNEQAGDWYHKSVFGASSISGNIDVFYDSYIYNSGNGYSIPTTNLLGLGAVSMTAPQGTIWILLDGMLQLKSADLQIMVPIPDVLGNLNWWNWWKMTLGTYRAYGSCYGVKDANGVLTQAPDSGGNLAPVPITTVSGARVRYRRVAYMLANNNGAWSCTNDDRTSSMGPDTGAWYYQMNSQNPPVTEFAKSISTGFLAPGQDCVQGNPVPAGTPDANGKTSYYCNGGPANPIYTGGNSFPAALPTDPDPAQTGKMFWFDRNCTSGILQAGQYFMNSWYWAYHVPTCQWYEVDRNSWIAIQNYGRSQVPANYMYGSDVVTIDPTKPPYVYSVPLFSSATTIVASESVHQFNKDVNGLRYFGCFTTNTAGQPGDGYYFHTTRCVWYYVTDPFSRYLIGKSSCVNPASSYVSNYARSTNPYWVLASQSCPWDWDQRAGAGQANIEIVWGRSAGTGIPYSSGWWNTYRANNYAADRTKTSQLVWNLSAFGQTANSLISLNINEIVMVPISGGWTTSTLQQVLNWALIKVIRTRGNAFVLTSTPLSPTPVWLVGNLGVNTIQSPPQLADNPANINSGNLTVLWPASFVADPVNNLTGYVAPSNLQYIAQNGQLTAYSWTSPYDQIVYNTVWNVWVEVCGYDMPYIYFTGQSGTVQTAFTYCPPSMTAQLTCGSDPTVIAPPGQNGGSGAGTNCLEIFWDRALMRVTANPVPASLSALSAPTQRTTAPTSIPLVNDITAWFYAGTLSSTPTSQTIPSNQVLAEPFAPSPGVVQWRITLASTIVANAVTLRGNKLLTNNNLAVCTNASAGTFSPTFEAGQIDPSVYTAWNGTDATPVAPEAANPSLFLEYVPTGSAPTNLTAQGRWYYNTMLLVWIDISDIWSRFLIATNAASGTPVYITNATNRGGMPQLPPFNTIANNTLSSNATVVNTYKDANGGTQAAGSWVGYYEVIWSRATSQPSGTPAGIPPTTAPAAGYYYAWKYKSGKDDYVNNWVQLPGNQVIAEPFAISGQQYFRPTTISRMISNAKAAQGTALVTNNNLAVWTTDNLGNSQFEAGVIGVSVTPNYANPPSYPEAAMLYLAYPNPTMPPPTLTAQGKWYYHIEQLIWVDISDLWSQFLVITNGLRGIPVYDTSTNRGANSPGNMIANNTCSSDRTIVNTFKDANGGTQAAGSWVGYYEVIWSRATSQPSGTPAGIPPTTAPAAGYYYAWKYKSGKDDYVNNWVQLPGNQVIAEPFAISGQQYFRPTTISRMISNVLNASIPSYTGYVAALVTNTDGSRSWQLAINSLVAASSVTQTNRADLAKYFTSKPFNLDATSSNIALSAPDAYMSKNNLSINNIFTGTPYSLGAGNTWAYHTQHMVWYEITPSADFPFTNYIVGPYNKNAIQATSALPTSQPLPFVNATNSMNSNAPLTPNSVATAIEVFTNRVSTNTTFNDWKNPIPTVPSLGAVFWGANTSGQSLYTGLTMSAVFGNYATVSIGNLLLAYSIPRTTATGVCIWVYSRAVASGSTSRFAAIDKNQLVLEPIFAADGTTLVYRPSTVSQLLASRPVNYTRYAAVLTLNGDGSKTWRLGVYGNPDPNGLGENAAVSQFANPRNTGSTIDTTFPPKTVDGYTLQDGYVWAYHKAHRVWYEISAQDWNTVLSYQYTVDINYYIPDSQYASFTMLNAKIPMDPLFPASTHGNVNIQKVSTGDSPYPGTSTLFSQYPTSVFGDASKPATRGLTGLPCQDSSGNPCTVFLNDIVWEPIKGYSAGTPTVASWRPTIASVIRVKSMNITDPVNYANTSYSSTSYAITAVMVQQTWRVGLLSLSDSLNADLAPSQFLATVLNLTPGNRFYPGPGNTVENYTLDPGYSWAYNQKLQIWFAVDKISLERINAIGMSGNIDNTISTAWPEVFRNNTDVLGNASDGLSNAYSGNIEVCHGRALNLDVADVQAGNAAVQSSVNAFTLSANSAAQAFASSPQVNVQIQMPVYAMDTSTTSGAWIWINIPDNTVVYEPFLNNNGIVQWKPNLAGYLSLACQSNDLQALFGTNFIIAQLQAQLQQAQSMQADLNTQASTVGNLIPSSVIGQVQSSVNAAILNIQSAITTAQQNAQQGQNLLQALQTAPTSGQNLEYWILAFESKLS